MEFAHTVAMPPDDLPSPRRAIPFAPATGHIGRYELKYRIGDGGAGTVYAARDPVLSRMIALKALNLDLAPSDRTRIHALFLDEARAAAKLSHPHIVTVFDAGVSEQGPYIAMELLKGKDLRELLFDMGVEGRGFAPNDAAMLMRRVAEAIDYAHNRGIVHRDIKPANIFMVGRNNPKVLDFGIARLIRKRPGGPGGATSIQPVAGGSPYYMAPEILDDAPGDPRSDIFSLGVVLYEMLAGEKPFHADSLDDVFEAIARHNPPPPSKINPAVPEALSRITMRALSKDPTHRPASAASFARDLRRYLHSVNGEITQPRRERETGRWNQGTESSTTTVRKAAWAGAGVLALLALLAATWIAWITWSGQQADTPAPVETVASVPAPQAAPAPPDIAALAVAAEGAGFDANPVLPADDAAQRMGTPEAAAPAAAPAPARPSAARARPAATPPAPAAAPPTRTGTLALAISPWGEVEVNGRSMGIAPPLSELTLPAGRHRVVIRNGDLPPRQMTVDIEAEQTFRLRHRF